jgi:SulP family sulfate permease
VPVLDSSAAATIGGLVRKAERQGARLYLTGARPAVRRVLLAHGVRPPRARFRASIDSALAAARGELSSASAGSSAD